VPEGYICGRRRRHSFEKLAPVKDANAVEEHDRSGGPIGPVICAVGANAPMAGPQQDCPNAEREAANVYLANQIADTDQKASRIGCGR
jgi:hypothetical protein